MSHYKKLFNYMKQVEIKIPDYITVGTYQTMSKLESLSELDRLVKLINTITGIESKEIRSWNIEALQQVAEAVGEVVERKGEFHAILEFGDKLYGFSNLSKFTLGEYIDLEEYLKEPTINLHKIAALMYRPVTKHNFDSISYMVKNTIKIANNKVENIFDHYKIEKYDSETVIERQELFKQFPVHIVLGALSFFLFVGSSYLGDIASSETEKIDPKAREILEKSNLDLLLASIGGGSGLYTPSANLVYYSFPAKQH